MFNVSDYSEYENKITKLGVQIFNRNSFLGTAFFKPAWYKKHIGAGYWCVRHLCPKCESVK